MICPYCKQEIPSADFALKTPEGSYFHFPCADMALDEWVKMKEENAILREAILNNSQVIVNMLGMLESEVINILRKQLLKYQQEIHRLRYPELYFGMAASMALRETGKE